MKVRFVTPYFPPEVGAAQTRIHELAVRLSRLGHEVSVLTTLPNYPSGIVPEEWRGRFFWNGTDAGIRIYRIWSYAAPNRGFYKRIAVHLSFALFASLAAIALPKCDALVIESPPLFDGIVGLVVRGLRRSPYLFTVSDLWPESAIQMGMLNNSALIWATKRLELLFYRHAAAVLTLTSGIRNAIVADGIAPSKVRLFRNSVDCDFFKPGLDATSLRAQLGVSESDFLVLYAGTFGLAQNLQTILQTAALVPTYGRNNIRFVLAGDGPESEILKKTASNAHLDNVAFVDPLPKVRVPELINAADCVLVPLRNLKIFRGALPTKLFEAMACARPVIVGIQGEAEELVRAANAGYCVIPESPESVCDALLRLMEDRQHASLMGENGRDYVLRHFNRDVRAAELSEALEYALEHTRNSHWQERSLSRL